MPILVRAVHHHLRHRQGASMGEGSVTRPVRFGWVGHGHRHGIGIGKRDLMVEQHRQGAIAVMHAIKSALDPRGILNPGRLYAEF